MAHRTAQPKDRDGFEIAIICALRSEADAVEALFDEYWDEDGDPYGRAQGDTNSYTTGSIGRHNVVLAYMPGIGRSSAASVATSFRSSFRNIRLALAVGICGGVPILSDGSEILLGDVIISTGVIQHDFGRQLPDGFVPKDTLEDNLGRPNIEIRTLLAKLGGLRGRKRLGKNTLSFINVLSTNSDFQTSRFPGRDEDKLYKSTYRHKHRDPAACTVCSQPESKEEKTCAAAFGQECTVMKCDETMLVPRRRLAGDKQVEGITEEQQPSIHFGRIASADGVMKSGEHRDQIAAEKSVIGFEMEGAGIWDSFPCVIIKGVCDYADSHKQKNWQGYAALAAAACLKAFLMEWNPNPTPTAEAVVRADIESACPVPAAKDSSFQSTLPNHSNHRFSGRKVELCWIRAVFANSPKLHQRVCLYGLGSIGKSELAFKYAQECSQDRSVFWIKADTAENLEKGYLTIAYKLIPNLEPRNIDIFLTVKGLLERPDALPWLMIFDGADDTSVFFDTLDSNNRIKYIPQSPQGQILVTSRNERILYVASGALVDPKNGIQIGPMSVQDGTELFQMCIGIGHNDLDVQIHQPLGVKFLEMLGGLPLAIVQATTYIVCEETTIECFIDLYQKMDSHALVFSQPTLDIDKRVISVLITWEISYNRIEDKMRLGSKSQAAMLLDLLGFIDSQSSPLRALSEAEYFLRDVEGPSPIQGFERSFGSQENPSRLISSVFKKRFLPNTDSKFKSAIAQLRQYSLINSNECWVPPVVHSWISQRLDAKERCKYVQWLIEELWHQILMLDDESQLDWEDYLLPPTFHQLVFHELTSLRHARVILDHAGSRTVRENMAEHHELALESVELLHRLGRMLAFAGKKDEGIYYLEKAIEGIELLTPPLPPEILSERLLQMAKIRFHSLPANEALTEAHSLATRYPSNRAAIWLAQCQQSAGLSQEASDSFRGIVDTLTAVQSSSDPELSREIFAAAFGAATVLNDLGDLESKHESRNIIDKHLVPFLSSFHDGDTLKVIILPQVLMLRLEVATDQEDHSKAVQYFLTHNVSPYQEPEESLTGGKPLQWSSLIEELRGQGKWSAIQILGETFAAKRHSFKTLYDLRWDRRRLQSDSDFYQLLYEIEAWCGIYYHLGVAYAKLQKVDKAEKAHWNVFGLYLALFPVVFDRGKFEANLWRLRSILVAQRKDRIVQLIWHFFQDSLLKEDAPLLVGDA